MIDRDACAADNASRDAFASESAFMQRFDAYTSVYRCAVVQTRPVTPRPGAAIFGASSVAVADELLFGLTLTPESPRGTPPLVVD